MPLTQHEVERLGQFLTDNGMVADSRQHEQAARSAPMPYSGDQIDQLLSAVSQQMATMTRLCEMAEQIADHLLTAINEQAKPKASATADKPKAETAEKPKRKRGRPTKAEQEAKAKAAEQEAKPNGEAKAADDNPFNEPQDKTGEPDFLGDPLADGDAEDEAPAISKDELKDVLQAYMNQHGAAGTPKLTALLGEFGVKRFNELPPEKYAAVAAKAKAEMTA